MRAGAIVAGGAVLAIGALFMVRPLPPSRCDHAMPILCAELPEDGDALARTLTVEPDAWRWNVWVDMPFLLAYASLLALSAASFRSKLARVPMIAAILGAAFDVSENIGILRAIGARPSDAHAAWIAISAHTKFILLELACAAIFALRVREGGRARWVFALFALPSLAGLAGPFVPMLVEIGAVGIALACIYGITRAIRQRPSPAS